MSESTIDLGWRPKSYEASERIFNKQISTLSGQERVNAVRNFLRDGLAPRQWKRFLAAEELTEQERLWAGIWYPTEVPSDYSTCLIEIAHVSIASIHGEHYSIGAIRTANTYQYRISTDVVENADELVSQPFETKALPLTLGELIELIDGSFVEGDVFAAGGLIRGNWRAAAEDETLESALSFVSVDSAYYEHLSDYYDKEGIKWMAEECSEYD